MIGNPDPVSTMYKDKGYHIMNSEEGQACFWGKQLQTERETKRDNGGIRKQNGPIRNGDP